MGAAARTQINVVMSKVDDIKQVENLRDFIFPVFWFSDGIEKIDDDDTISLLRMALNLPEVARSIM